MGIFIKKPFYHFKADRITKLGAVAFIVTLATAYIGTIWAVFLDSFLHNTSYVGFLMAFLTAISFASYFLFIPIIEKSSKSHLYSLALAILALAYVLLSFDTNVSLLIVLSVIITIAITIRITCFGIIIKNKSKSNQLSSNEGFIYSLVNTAWVIGPLIALAIISNFNIRAIFLFAAFFMIFALLLFKYENIKDNSQKKKIDYSIIKNFKDFFKKRERRISYVLSGGVNLWWALIYTYIPLFIIRNALTEKTVSYFLFAVPIPLITLEYYFAKKANKCGFKKMFKSGFIIAALAALACFFVSNIYIILALLVLASIGMAMLEPTTEAYFFDISSKQEAQRFYGPYNTTIDVNLFLGEILAATLLLFLPFKYVFLLFSALMFILFLISFKAKNILEFRRK